MEHISEIPEEDIRKLIELENSYLEREGPRAQSGFGGDEKRWRAQRGPVLGAITSDGEFLDVGCANGHLLECLILWAKERDINLTPYGLDQGEKLIELTRQRLPKYTKNFFTGNLWDWTPPHKFKYVSSSLCVPDHLKRRLFEKLTSKIVAPGGRLVLRSYYNVKNGERDHYYFDNVAFLESIGVKPVGTAFSDPPGADYVWIDC